MPEEERGGGPIRIPSDEELLKEKLMQEEEDLEMVNRQIADIATANPRVNLLAHAVDTILSTEILFSLMIIGIVIYFAFMYANVRERRRKQAKDLTVDEWIEEGENELAERLHKQMKEQYAADLAAYQRAAAEKMANDIPDVLANLRQEQGQGEESPNPDRWAKELEQQEAGAEAAKDALLHFDERESQRVTDRELGHRGCAIRDVKEGLGDFYAAPTTKTTDQWIDGFFNTVPCVNVALGGLNIAKDLGSNGLGFGMRIAHAGWRACGFISGLVTG